MCVHVYCRALEGERDVVVPCLGKVCVLTSGRALIVTDRMIETRFRGLLDQFQVRNWA